MNLYDYRDFCMTGNPGVNENPLVKRNIKINRMSYSRSEEILKIENHVNKIVES